MKLLSRFSLLVLPLALAACRAASESPVDPEVGGIDPAGSHACPPHADFVVTDEAGLNAALAAAGSGDVIAIDGTIALTDQVIVNVGGVRLTCDSPGAGLEVAAGHAPSRLLWIQADRVRVDHLSLDATGTTSLAVYAVDDPVAQLADVMLTDNDVVCGPALCAFFVGVQRAAIEDNAFSGTGPSITGVHLQGNPPIGPDGRFTIVTDGTRVVGNSITTDTPSGNPLFGGIRVRDGEAVAVEDNTVTGPWANSVATSELVAGRLARNALTGAGSYGILVSTNPLTPISTERSVFQENRVSGAGAAGIRVLRGCDNRFVRNDLSGNAGNLGILFEPQTGDNLVNGTGGALVVDNGAFDCDGDGTDDPNRIVGTDAAPSTAPSAARAPAPAAGSGSPDLPIEPI